MKNKLKLKFIINNKQQKEEEKDCAKILTTKTIIKYQEEG